MFDIVFAAGQLLNSIRAVYAMCTQSRQHEVLTRTEWILAGTGDASPTFNRHWVGVGLYSPPAPLTRYIEPVWFIVGPLLLYRSEIWGHSKYVTIERVHLKCCKRLLGVGSTTSDVVVVHVVHLPYIIQ